MIGIVDSGINNLQSIHNALVYIGADIKICTQPEDFEECERIMLPGVGAYGALMAALKARGMIAPLERAVFERKLPTMGICLGMQVMSKRSYEHGEFQGLGWFESEVVPLTTSDRQFRVPHVGWNNVTLTSSHPMTKGLEGESDFYFVHSLHMRCARESDVVGWSDHGGKFTAIIARDNIFATQFHPEKSQSNGIQLLRNFLEWELC